MVKFGNYLRTNKVQEWSENYIEYDALKLKIKVWILSHESSGDNVCSYF